MKFKITEDTLMRVYPVVSKPYEKVFKVGEEFQYNNGNFIRPGEDLVELSSGNFVNIEYSVV